MTTETTRATTGASAAVPTFNSRLGMIYLDLLSYRETGTTAISIRRRWSASFPDESLAVAQAIALLKQHAELCGFILVPDGLQAVNDAYLNERTITRATMARKARQRRKQAEVQQMDTADAKQRRICPPRRCAALPATERGKSCK